VARWLLGIVLGLTLVLGGYAPAPASASTGEDGVATTLVSGGKHKGGKKKGGKKRGGKHKHRKKKTVEASA
jgi:hypothetical protein